MILVHGPQTDSSSSSSISIRSFRSSRVAMNGNEWLNGDECRSGPESVFSMGFFRCCHEKPLRIATCNFYFAFSWLAPLSHLRVRWKVATPIAELVGAAIAFMAVVAPIDPGSPGQQFTFEAKNLCEVVVMLN